MQTAVRANSGHIAEIDEDGEFGTVTRPAVVGKSDGTRGQVIPEGSTPRRAMVSKIIDAVDEERKAAMRRFFRLAAQEGLDTNDGQRMRAALALFLGRPVYSRADLSAGQWAECEAGLWVGHLAW